MSKAGGTVSGNRVLKVLIAGAAKTGKTSLLRNFNGLDFLQTYTPTVNTDFSVKNLALSLGTDPNAKETVCVQLWDVGATSSMGKSFFRNTNGVVFVVDCAVLATEDGDNHLLALGDIYDRVSALANFADDAFPCLLMANKADAYRDAAERTAVLGKIQAWIKDKRKSSASPISLIEVSAKNGQQVGEAFEAIIRQSMLSPAKLLPANAATALNNKQVDAQAPDSSAKRPQSEANCAKVIVAGALGVGKTTILQRYCSGHKAVLSSSYEPTIGADFRVVDVPARSSSVKLQIWDSSGDLNQQRLGRALYRSAVCLLLVFDITSADSFNALDLYWDNYVNYSDVNDVFDFPVVLVGNKCDLSNLRAVSIEDILDWCAKKRPRKPVTYVECSALRNIQVGDVFVVAGDSTYDYINARDDAEEENEEEEEDQEEAGEDDRRGRGRRQGGQGDGEDEGNNIDNYDDDNEDEDDANDGEGEEEGNASSNSEGAGDALNSRDAKYTKTSESNYKPGAPRGSTKNNNGQQNCFDFSSIFKWFF